MYRMHASCGLKTYLYARFVIVFLDGLAHDVSGFRRSGRFEFPGGRFDIVGSGIHGQQGGFLDVRGSLQTARFEDDFHFMVAAGRFQFADFVAERLVVAAQELADGHDDVYLRGAVFDSQGRFGHFDFNQSLRGGETARHAGYFHALHFERLADDLCEAGIDADGGHVRQVGVGVLECVHAFRETEDAFFAVRGAQ